MYKNLEGKVFLIMIENQIFALVSIVSWLGADSSKRLNEINIADRRDG